MLYGSGVLVYRIYKRGASEQTESPPPLASPPGRPGRTAVPPPFGPSSLPPSTSPPPESARAEVHRAQGWRRRGLLPRDPPSQPATSASCAAAGNRGQIRPSPRLIRFSRGRICHRDRVVVRHRRRRLPWGVAPLVALVGARHCRPWVLRRRPPGPDPVTPSPDPGSAGRFLPGRRLCSLSGRLFSGGSVAVVAARRRGGLRGARSCALVAA